VFIPTRRTSWTAAGAPARSERRRAHNSNQSRSSSTWSASNHTGSLTDTRTQAASLQTCAALIATAASPVRRSRRPREQCLRLTTRRMYYDRPPLSSSQRHWPGDPGTFGPDLGGVVAVEGCGPSVVDAFPFTGHPRVYARPDREVLGRPDRVPCRRLRRRPPPRTGRWREPSRASRQEAAATMACATRCSGRGMCPGRAVRHRGGSEAGGPPSSRRCRVRRAA
jgi:hypothetical protein